MSKLKNCRDSNPSWNRAGTCRFQLGVELRPDFNLELNRGNFSTWTYVSTKCLQYLWGPKISLLLNTYFLSFVVPTHSITEPRGHRISVKMDFCGQKLLQARGILVEKAFYDVLITILVHMINRKSFNTIQRYNCEPWHEGS